MAKLATFIILPLAGLVLNTGEFNLWAIVFPSVQVLSSAFSFGLPNYILRSFYKDDDHQKKIVNNQIFNSFLIIVLITIVFFVAGLLYKIKSPFFRWEIYAIIITNSFLLIIQQKYQAEKKGKEYLIQSLLWRNFFALILLTSILFGFKVGLDNLLYSLLLIQATLCVWGIYKECIPFAPGIQNSIQVSIFKFGFPLFLIGMMQYLVSINSRYFVYNQGVENDTAIFSIIQTFVGGLNLLFVIFVRIYIPKLFGVLSGNASYKSLDLYKKIVFPLFEILTLGILLSLFVYSSFYKTPFDDQIFKLTPVLIIGQFFYGMQIFVADSIVYKGHTIKLLIINSIVTFISMFIGFFMVKYYGVFGGAVSVALTQLISLLLILLATKSLFMSIIGKNYFLLKLFRITFLILTFSQVYSFFDKTVLLICLIVVIVYLTLKFKNLIGNSFFKENHII